MPVTAKLSKKFYDALGEDIANELVEWFNAVDATYRADLRELNELNFARFRAEIHQEVGQLRGEMRAGLAELRADLIKWMFIFVATAVLAILGLG